MKQGKGKKVVQVIMNLTKQDNNRKIKRAKSGSWNMTIKTKLRKETR